MNARTWIQIVIGTVGYTAWAGMVSFDHSLLPDFLKFNIAMAVGTIGLALRDLPPPTSAATLSTQTPEAAPTARQGNAQSGYGLPLLLGAIALGMTLVILAAHPQPMPGQAAPTSWCSRHPDDEYCHS